MRIPLPPNKDELYALSQNINNLLDRIEYAIEREKQFTSDASHELRTPLAVIKGTMEVLIRKPRNQVEYEDKINFCISEVDRLNKMIDQLLLLARFENQKQNINNESVYLNAVLLDQLTRFSEKIAIKKITINSDFSSDFYVYSDAYLVSIIIGNLISNAIKYSNNSGKISIKLSQHSDTILFTIIDNGIGISQTDLEKVFYSFYRADSLNSSNIKGTGLGLSIVKRLCELLNITISIESELNIGTIIKLSLPLDKLK
jgi:signal transduction histidine kinase